MAQVRVPQVAEPMLQFCRPWADKRDNACFGTYPDRRMML